MKRLFSWCIPVAISLLLVSVAATQAADEKKADPTGTWTWSTQRRGGGEARESTLKLKMEGEKLVGTITGMGGRENKVENAKVLGDELTFDVKREFQGNTFTSKYKGKISGDTITGKVVIERNGQSNERDWTAKRKKEESK